jgi:hypothetical protein
MQKDFRKVIREAERQGWKIRPIKKGFFLAPPEKGKDMVLVHHTPSTQAAFNHFLADMRRSGFKG